MLPPPLIAQESTEEPVIIPSETPLPSPTFTEIPTNTPLPSETPTELPTATLWPTETATELPISLFGFTETATQTPTNTVTATPTYWDIPISNGIVSCRGEICATVSVQKGTSHGTYVETIRDGNTGILQVTVKFSHFISNINYILDIYAPYPAISFRERGGHYYWFNQGIQIGGNIWDYPHIWAENGGGQLATSGDTLEVIATHVDTGFADQYARWRLFRINSFTLGAPVPTPTPSPTATNTATATATNTPTPTFTPTPVPWDVVGEVLINPFEPIPPISEARTICERTEFRDSRGPCALLAYDQYNALLGGDITWGEFAALVMYSEGHSILLGQNQGGSLVLGNPQNAGYGTCWNRVSGNWLSGSNQCSVPTAQYAPGVQEDFPYAVWEWIFNECAAVAGFTGYMRNNAPYQGECSQDGFLEFLYKVQTLYTDTDFLHNPTLYLSLAQSEFALWHFQDGDEINERYEYGVCPCTWGNEPDQTEARNGDGRSYNGNNSFSYFEWDAEDAPDADNRFFKLY